jgi:cytochrome c oxidase subunit 2
VNSLPLFPHQASAASLEVDHLLYFLLGVSAFFCIAVAALVFYYAVRYRAGNKRARPASLTSWRKYALEITFASLLFGLSAIMFFWGADLYFQQTRRPAGAMEVYVIGKQWMWKVEHPGGRREIDQLHVPVGRPVRLIMTSEDVIHDFFIPAFRAKQDVVPGRYTTMWFTPSVPGSYHLFCAQYCGTNHARMVGNVIAMNPDKYAEWLGSGTGFSMAHEGEILYNKLQCTNCHAPGKGAGGPNLNGLFGRMVELADGRTALADEAYIRESILNPDAKVIPGFRSAMPSFQGIVTEDQLLQLIAYVKSLHESPYLANRTSSPMDNATTTVGKEP